MSRSSVYRIGYTLSRRNEKEGRMRVIVNRTLCESNAVCARLVPEVFLVDDDDRLQIRQEQPAEELRERVEHAVRRCPKLALSIVED
jgi:ferredoxin